MLRVTNLAMDRGETRTLDVPALDIGAKESLLLRGASGSGKTTLLHILAGLLRPTGGTVSFNGEAYAGLADARMDMLRRRYFGFVFQQMHLIKHLSVRDNIRLAAPRADLAALLPALGLAGKEKKKISDLSVGESQRVAIARALANNPAVLFADEPTSALDDVNTAAVLALLRESAARNGAALIVASHDARIMNGFDRILTLDQGKPLP
jgi:putative ABC transport system ATP-binding protein